MKKYSAIIAARSGSTRLPGKALLPLKNIPMLTFLIRRLKTSQKINKLILATTKLSADDALAKLAKNEGINVFRGDENDVIKRFVEASNAENIEYVVRITGDCPFVDGDTLDYCIEQCDKYDFDLATTKTYFPTGIDFEIYKASVMQHLHETLLTIEEREHLTLPIYNRAKEYKIFDIQPPVIWPDWKHSFTVDTHQDYSFAKKVIEQFKDIDFSIISLLKNSHNLQ